MKETSCPWDFCPAGPSFKKLGRLKNTDPEDFQTATSLCRIFFESQYCHHVYIFHEFSAFLPPYAIIFFPLSSANFCCSRISWWDQVRLYVSLFFTISSSHILIFFQLSKLLLPDFLVQNRGQPQFILSSSIQYDLFSMICPVLIHFSMVFFFPWKPSILVSLDWFKA